MDIDIRNPSGFCDHLYYPENCEICSTPIEDWGSELGQILADFEQDHNEVKAVKDISDLLSKAVEEERERVRKVVKKLECGFPEDEGDCEKAKTPNVLRMLARRVGYNQALKDLSNQLLS